MYPLQHLIFTGIFASGLFFLFPQMGFIGFLIITVSGVLIDVDHYLYYVYKRKNLSLTDSYRWYLKNEKKFLSLPREKRGEFYEGFFFLHGIEILVLLIIFMFFSKYFLFVFTGFIFHLFLDIFYQRKRKDRIDRISFVNDFFKFKKLKFIGE